MSHRRRAPMVVFGLLVSVLFGWLFVRSVDWPVLGRALSRAHYVYLVPALAGVMLLFVLKAIRWRVILSPVAKPSFRSLYSSIMIGFMGNDVLPARMGELLRPVALRLRSTVPVSTALATIVVERIFDMLALAVYMYAAFWWLGARGAAAHDADTERVTLAIRAFGLFSGFVALAILSGLVAIRLFPCFCRKVNHGICRWALGLATAVAEGLGAGDGVMAPLRRIEAGLEGFLDAFVDGLSVIRSVRQGVAIFALSLAHWAPLVFVRWVAAMCFDGFAMPWGGAALVFVFTALAVAVPQAPGYIGTFQLATVAAVTLSLGARPEAAAYAILLWAVEVFPVIAIGLGCLWLEGLSLRELRRRAEETAEPG